MMINAKKPILLFLLEIPEFFPNNQISRKLPYSLNPKRSGQSTNDRTINEVHTECKFISMLYNALKQSKHIK